MNKEETGKRGYTSPRVQTLHVHELLEAVGPVQGLSSGAEAGPVEVLKKPFRGRGKGHGRGRGHR